MTSSQAAALLMDHSLDSVVRGHHVYKYGIVGVDDLDLLFSSVALSFPFHGNTRD